MNAKVTVDNGRMVVIGESDLGRRGFCLSSEVSAEEAESDWDFVWKVLGDDQRRAHEN